MNIMQDLITTQTINDDKKLKHFFTKFDKRGKWLFRGQLDSYELLPSILRTKKFNTRAELYIYELGFLILFYRKCNNHGMRIKQLPKFSGDYFSEQYNFSYILNNDYYWFSDEVLELAALAQHYGIKTRLLDWSQDRMTALYFACVSAEKKKQDTAVWAINASKMQQIKVEQRSNIEKACIIAYYDKNKERKGWDNITYKELFNMWDDSLPLIFNVPDYSRNPNLYAQQGVLSMWQYNLLDGMQEKVKQSESGNLLDFRNCASEQIEFFLRQEPDCRPLDQKLGEYFSTHEQDMNCIQGYPLLYKFIIPVSMLKTLKDKLKIAGYSRARIFPGFQSIAEEVNEEMEKKH